MCADIVEEAWTSSLQYCTEWLLYSSWWNVTGDETILGVVKTFFTFFLISANFTDAYLAVSLFSDMLIEDNTLEFRSVFVDDVSIDNESNLFKEVPFAS